MKKIITLALCIFVALSLVSCGDGSPDNSVHTSAELRGKNIGALKNSASAVFASEIGSVKTFDSPEALADALRMGSVDCVLSSAENASSVLEARRKLKKLKEPYFTSDICMAVAKENIGLTNDINAALITLNEDGVLKSIQKYYNYGKGERYAHAEYDDSTVYIRLAAVRDFYPYSFTDENGELCGIDIDTAYAVCDILGIGLEIDVLDRSSLIDSVWYGEVQFSMGCIFPAKDVLEKVDLTDPYSNISQVIIVRK